MRAPVPSRRSGTAGKQPTGHGFALTELVVVLAIIGLLSTITTIAFNSWNRKAQIERQTREFASDLNMARTESLYRKQRHALVMNGDATGYILRRYSSADEKRDSAVPAKGIVTSKKVAYQFAKESGASIANAIFQFDTNGFTATAGDNDTVRVNPVGSGAAFDCVVISSSRINIGQMSGGTTCVQK